MALHNVTVDDADTNRIIYENSEVTGWSDQNCAECVAKPTNLSEVFDTTWHDTTRYDWKEDHLNVSLHFPFVGSAVYVFGIEVNGTSGITPANTSLIFELDGKWAGNYSFTPTGPNYTYHVPFFTKNDLKHGFHNLSMIVNGTSMVLFDYIVYSTNEIDAGAPPPAQQVIATSTNHTGAIAGGVVGGFAGLVLLITLVWALFFRKRRNHGDSSREVAAEQEKMDDQESRHQHTSGFGILARLHGHNSGLDVEPLTLAEREERERYQSNFSGKGGAFSPRSGTGLDDLSGRVGSSSVRPESIDPPSSTPSSSREPPSPVVTRHFSQIQQQQLSTLTSNLHLFNGELSPVIDNGENHNIIAGMVSHPSGSQTAQDDAPPAYGIGH